MYNYKMTKAAERKNDEGGAEWAINEETEEKCMSLVSAPCHGKRVLIPPPADVTSAPHKKCRGTRPDNGSDLLDFCLRSAIFTCGPRPAQMRTRVGPMLLHMRNTAGPSFRLGRSTRIPYRAQHSWPLPATTAHRSGDHRRILFARQATRIRACPSSHVGRVSAPHRTRGYSLFSCCSWVHMTY